MEWLEYLRWGSLGWGDELLTGFSVTLALALATLPLGLGLGMLAATALLRHGLLHGVAKVYTTLLRGLPELLTLFVIYNGLSMLLNLLCRINGVDGFVALSPFTAGMLALGLVFGAYAAEVISGAYLALDKGPREAGMALGMPRWQILLLIEWPALIRLALPGLGNLWLNLVKDTALVSVIALNDLMRVSTVAVGATRKPFLFFLLVCLLYWLICGVSGRVLVWLERKTQRGYPTARQENA